MKHFTLFVRKTDGNGAIPKEPARIWIQKLSADGLSLDATSSKVMLFENTEPWEYDCVEGPWIIKRQYNQKNIWYLFYSGNTYNTDRYAVGLAVSVDSIYGPYFKSNNKLPILFTPKDKDLFFSGPGHCSVIKCPVNDQYYMIYHTWENGHVDDPNPGRVMNVDLVQFVDVSLNATVAQVNMPSHASLPTPCKLQ